MTNGLRPQPGIEDIVLYKGGESSLAGRSDVLKLSSNENPFGTSDAAKAAFAPSAECAWMKPRQWPPLLLRPPQPWWLLRLSVFRGRQRPPTRLATAAVA